jgi:cystathionine beta-lyase/cystathionine gamma-synthase
MMFRRSSRPCVASLEAIIMIDNTWAAGVLFKALEFGIDISIQAGTKYLIGHSDAMVGTACPTRAAGISCVKMPI